MGAYPKSESSILDSPDAALRARRDYTPMTPQVIETRTPPYSAFISYSRRRDIALAKQLHSRITCLTSPLRKDRRVFLDQADLENHLQEHPEINEALIDAVTKADMLILFASPPAALSPYIELEVATFLRHSSHEKLLFAVTDLKDGGELSHERFSEIVPPSVQALFASGFEPLAVDLTSFRDCSVADPQMRLAVAKLVAAIDRVPLDDIVLRKRRSKIGWIGRALRTLLQTRSSP